VSVSVNDVIAIGEIENANGENANDEIENANDEIENANDEIENANDALGAGKKAGLAGACEAAGSGRPGRAQNHDHVALLLSSSSTSNEEPVPSMNDVP